VGLVLATGLQKEKEWWQRQICALQELQGGMHSHPLFTLFSFQLLAGGVTHTKIDIQRYAMLARRNFSSQLTSPDHERMPPHCTASLVITEHFA